MYSLPFVFKNVIFGLLILWPGIISCASATRWAGDGARTRKKRIFTSSHIFVNISFVTYNTIIKYWLDSLDV
ncbi:MAG TPA: hypothetical protein VN703_09735 [Candidatus Sulfopaludibacter sp.]|nr:hypothetical protein [Candidatus Sulfopaludibacter sp.]